LTALLFASALALAGATLFHGLPVTHSSRAAETAPHSPAIAVLNCLAIHDAEHPCQGYPDPTSNLLWRADSLPRLTMEFRREQNPELFDWQHRPLEVYPARVCTMSANEWTKWQELFRPRTAIDMPVQTVTRTFRFATTQQQDVFDDYKSPAVLACGAWGSGKTEVALQKALAPADSAAAIQALR
jgi:hypothetical protein